MLPLSSMLGSIIIDRILQIDDIYAFNETKIKQLLNKVETDPNLFKYHDDRELLRAWIGITAFL